MFFCIFPVPSPHLDTISRSTCTALQLINNPNLVQVTTLMAQLFGFPPGYFVIRSVATDRLWDVSSDEVEDGAPIILWPEKEQSLVEGGRFGLCYSRSPQAYEYVKASETRKRTTRSVASLIESAYLRVSCFSGVFYRFLGRFVLAGVWACDRRRGYGQFGGYDRLLTDLDSHKGTVS